MITKTYRAIFLYVNHCTKTLNRQPVAKELKFMLRFMFKVICLYILACIYECQAVRSQDCSRIWVYGTEQNRKQSLQ